jgi:hypothetical protein
MLNERSSLHQCDDRCRAAEQHNQGRGHLRRHSRLKLPIRFTSMTRQNTSSGRGRSRPTIRPDSHPMSLGWKGPAWVLIRTISSPLRDLGFRNSRPRRSGSHKTPRWREMDSNPRSPVRRLTQTRSNGDVQHPCAAVGHARSAHPTICHDDRPYPRSVIAGADAFVWRDLAGLRGRTRDVMRFLWNRNGTLPAQRGP